MLRTMRRRIKRTGYCRHRRPEWLTSEAQGDNAWTQSPCRPDVWIYGVPGQGSWTWHARWGTFWVGGGVYQAWKNQGYEWKNQGYECGILGPAVKAYGWIAEMNYGQGCPGQWFEGGAVGYHNGAWRIMYGNYGQTAGRLHSMLQKVRREHVAYRSPFEKPSMPTTPAPPINREMQAQVDALSGL